MKTNYQLITNDIINNLHNTPTLLLHSCCAPCSSYVLEYLAKYFKIIILYYNPNIYPKEEYSKRKKEVEKLLTILPNISFMELEYNEDDFNNKIKGLEHYEEGNLRCFKCYELRMEKTARKAKELGIDFFTTTLSVSPHKNAQIINSIGKSLEDKYKVKYLYADFKKRNGYKRSIELSTYYNLYRQDYCGCKYSLEKKL